MRRPALALVVTLLILGLLQVVAVTTESQAAAQAVRILVWAVPALAAFTLGQELYHWWQARKAAER